MLAAFLGLKEVAVAMSDPFGDDDIDFDTTGMLSGAYNNAVACLQDSRPVASKKLNGLSNPVVDGIRPASATAAKISLPMQANIPEGWPPVSSSSKSQLLL